MKLTLVERWLLSNQFAILEKLYPEDAPIYSNSREIIERGYEGLYEQITEYLFTGHSMMSEEDCDEVFDILRMYEQLQSSYDRLDDKSGLSTAWIAFPGFDGNNEANFKQFTAFLLEREGRFSDLRYKDDLNSHVPSRPIYARMKQAWQESSDPYNLEKDDLRRILDAVTYRD